MIDRYSTKEMAEIWSKKSKFARWIKIESILNKVLIKSGTIPANKLSEDIASINIDKIIGISEELEETYRHDVISFVFAAEKLCIDGRWIHYGLTSSDILDTASAMAIKESNEIILNDACRLYEALNEKKSKYNKTEIIGRTHGQSAEIVRIGDIFSLFSDELIRNIQRLFVLKIPGKLSGAVGNNKYIPNDIEKECLAELGVPYTPTNQIVSRDYYAELVSNLTLMACGIEKMALQIRLYQQSGINEMSEPFYAEQKGSSAMPHKRNPILCENICGLSRVVRGYLMTAMENVALWQERDISHSSAERIILPDVYSLVHFMILRMTSIINGLEINTEIIEKHIKEFGASDSQEKMLELIKGGCGRLEAYEMIQRGDK